MKQFLVVVAALLTVACSAEKSFNPVTPAAVDIVSVAPPADTVVVIPTPPTLPPPSPDIPYECRGIHSTVVVGGDGSYYTVTNPCEVEKTYVVAVFARLSADFYDQQLVWLGEWTLAGGEQGTLQTIPLFGCYQTDLYTEITKADIESGGVKIHPTEYGQPGFVNPIGFFLSPTVAQCLPPPPPPPTCETDQRLCPPPPPPPSCETDQSLCPPPPPPPTCSTNPELCPPPPPPPPMCEDVNTPSFTQLTVNRGASGSVIVNNTGAWKLVLYATTKRSEYPDNADWVKDTDMNTQECAEHSTLRVRYDWTGHQAKYWWVKVFRNGVEVGVSEVLVK